MSLVFGEHAWHVSLKESDELKKYRMLNRKVFITGHWSSPLSLEQVQGTLTLEVDPGIDILPESRDGYEDRDFDGATDEWSSQRAVSKHKLLDLPDECAMKKRKTAATIA